LKNIVKFILICIIIFFLSGSAHAEIIKIASYNVENLFDLARGQTEYAEYIPKSPYGWNKKNFDIKLKNIAKLIKDLNPDIIGLQEIESERALIALQHRLSNFNVNYPYRAIANSKPTTVKCALLSKFPIISKQEIKIRSKSARNILKVEIKINKRHLIIFVNHWKSKHGPESQRIAYAKALKKDINELKKTTDFIILGDFNSNYNEYNTFIYNSKLNNTSGITGINHILKTIKDQKLVTENELIRNINSAYLYNLWLELDPSKRWSSTFFKEKNTPDSIILSPGLYDHKGLSYIDNSFDRFSPDYLFKENKIYRWQRSEKGRGRHLGLGYSDHLPIFACFSTKPFQAKNSPASHNTNYFNKADENKLININKAAAHQLIKINGIGPSLSKKIISKRPYRKIDDLLEVKGIGKKTLEKLRPYICIQESKQD